MNKITKADRIEATRLCKAYRDRHEISQGALSIKLDCFPGQVSNIEAGIRVPGTVIKRVLEELKEGNDE